jgi:hypothetical protein
VCVCVCGVVHGHNTPRRLCKQRLRHAGHQARQFNVILLRMPCTDSWCMPSCVMERKGIRFHPCEGHALTGTVGLLARSIVNAHTAMHWYGSDKQVLIPIVGSRQRTKEVAQISGLIRGHGVWSAASDVEWHPRVLTAKVKGWYSIRCHLPTKPVSGAEQARHSSLRSVGQVIDVRVRQRARLPFWPCSKKD